MMVIEFEDEPMTNFVFLKAVEIESKNPNVQNEYCDSSPSWKISGENGVIFDIQPLIEDDEDKCSKYDEARSNSEAHEEILFLRCLLAMGS